MKKTHIAVAVFIALFLIGSGAYLLIPEDYEHYNKIVNHVYDFTSLMVVVVFFFAFRSIQSRKVGAKVWLLLFIGLGCWLLGDLAWTLMIYLGKDPMPSPGDVFYMLGYVAVFFAVAMKYVMLGGRVSWGDRLNGIFVAFCFAAVTCSAVLLPIAISDYSSLGKFVLIFYPVADIVIILFAVIIISALRAEKGSLPWLGICLGMCIWAFADTLTAFYEWSGVETDAMALVDIPFLVGMLVIGLGAYHKMLLMKNEA
jgi:hypothetical protein